MGRNPRKKAIIHGRNAYKRSLCRCDICREANREHERRVRQRVHLPKMPLLHDTMTLSEFKKHRGYDTDEGR